MESGPVSVDGRAIVLGCALAAFGSCGKTATDSAGSGAGGSVDAAASGAGAGAAACATNVGGDVVVQTEEDLKRLAGVVAVEGSLHIEVDGVAGLGQLHCLQRVGGDLHVGRCELSSGSCEGNQQLGSLVGLEGLEQVGGDLAIWGNPALESVAALGSLISIGGELIVWGNARLTSLDGLGHLEAVHNLMVTENPELVSLEGLGGLERATCGVQIERNDKLESLSGLEALQQAHGVHVRRNPALESLSGLAALHSVEENADCPPSTAGLDIHQLPVESLASLPELTRIDGGLRVINNEELESLAGLAKLEVVTGGFQVENNPRLANLDALAGLGEIETWVTIQNCQGLVDVSGLGNASWRAVENGGVLLVVGNPLLEHLDGLEPSGPLESLSVADNAALLGGGNFTGLTSVTQLSVLRNSVLQDLGWLSTLTVVEAANIEENPTLPTCLAEEAAANWNVAGEALICGNLSDACGSEECPDRLRP